MKPDQITSIEDWVKRIGNLHINNKPATKFILGFKEEDKIVFFSQCPYSGRDLYIDDPKKAKIFSLKRALEIKSIYDGYSLMRFNLIPIE